MNFSLICPSIRPELWNEMCNSLSDNKLDWEILFIGPKSPINKLPKNAKWIETSVKPSQCTHIGFIKAEGEYTSLTADDALYFTPDHNGALDNMYKFIKNFPKGDTYNKEGIAYGFRMFEDQYCSETSHTHYIIPKEYERPQSMRSPLLYPFFVIKKETYLEVGGYDNRFICGQAENDFLYRVYLRYGHTQGSLCPTAMVWAIHDKHNNTSGYRKYHEYECSLMRKLWIYEHEGDTTRWNRERSDDRIRGYINDDSLLTISQGYRGDGEWQ